MSQDGSEVIHTQPGIAPQVPADDGKNDPTAPDVRNDGEIDDLDGSNGEGKEGETNSRRRLFEDEEELEARMA